MAKLSTSSKKKSGIIKLKIMAQKLQKSLSLGKKSCSSWRRDDSEEGNDATCVPEDVKEGHFAVVAVDGEERHKRFVVPLSCLMHPMFLRLLEQAAEEFGFNREGALTIPCRPSELESILAEQYWMEKGGIIIVDGNWGSCGSGTMVPSC